jgi:amphi-Trp domain-containing protein
LKPKEDKHVASLLQIPALQSRANPGGNQQGKHTSPSRLVASAQAQEAALCDQGSSGTSHPAASPTNNFAARQDQATKLLEEAQKERGIYMSKHKVKSRDIEINCSTEQFIEKLRRLADSLESGDPFSIQISGERLTIPKNAVFSVEHERKDEKQEVEFQIKWKTEL